MTLKSDLCSNLSCELANKTEEQEKGMILLKINVKLAAGDALMKGLHTQSLCCCYCYCCTKLKRNKYGDINNFYDKIFVGKKII